jgi:hypothetical protein
MRELAEWDTFYVILGSAAGGLIGLQFVVMTLLAERTIPGAAQATSAFTSPTVLHFATCLLVSVLVRVPWKTMAGPAACCALIGALGVVYELIVAYRMWRQEIYDPQPQDWITHAIIPVAGFAALAISGFEARRHPAALFGIGFSVLGVLFNAIFNAWDGITYHVLVVRRKTSEPRE